MDDIKKEEGRWRAVGCSGWRNSVSHEIELAVCNTFGFEEDALQLYRVVHHRQRRLERRKFPLARLHAEFLR